MARLLLKYRVGYATTGDVGERLVLLNRRWGKSMGSFGEIANLAIWFGLAIMLIWLAYIVLPDNTSSS